MAFTTECETRRDRKPSQELLKELSEAFDFFDLNGDGKLSVKELGTVVRSLGEAVTDEDLRRLIKRVDCDGDGQLDLCEFIDLNTQAVSACGSLDSEPGSGCRDGESDALVAAFNKFDANKDGFISAEELHKVLAAFGDEKFSLEECRSMIRSVDENGDHVMSLHEFQTLMDDNRGFLTGGPESVEAAA
jgi:calcium-binding protein CML